MEEARPAFKASARLHLIAIIAAAVLPLWLYCAYLLADFAVRERAQIARDAMHVAQQASVPVESHLAGLGTIATGLAKSPALARRDWPAFRQEIALWAAGTDRVVALRDANTGVLSSRGDAGALRDLSGTERARLSRDQPAVSGVYSDASTADSRIAVTAPVPGSDLMVEVSIPTRAIHGALQPAVPSGWTVGVGDHAGTYVTRSTLHEEVTGKPGLPEYVSRVVGRSGTFTATGLQGDSILAGYYRSPSSDWFYTANIPESFVQAPLWRSLASAGIGAGIAFVASSALAYFVGNKLAKAASALAAQARELGTGAPFTPLTSSVVEFDRISRAFRDARLSLDKQTGEIRAVLETAPAAIWVTYDPDAQIVIRNRFAVEMMGLAGDNAAEHTNRPDKVVDTLAVKNGKVVPREDRPLSRAMRGEITDNQEFTYIVADGSERVLLTSARPIRDAAGTIIGAVQISLDISERKKAWHQRQLLVGELSHRMKNTMAVVQSIVSQTLRNAPDIETARNALTDRITALAKTHDILTQESWEGADLRDLVASSLEPYASQARFDLHGGRVWLPSSTALSLSLALNELTTNAVKYGALSNSSGRVVVSWEQKPAGGRVVIDWSETGGPPVMPSSRKGFGTRLLERVFDKKDGRIEISLRKEGLVCRIELLAGDPEHRASGF